MLTHTSVIPLVQHKSFTCVTNSVSSGTFARPLDLDCGRCNRTMRIILLQATTGHVLFSNCDLDSLPPTADRQRIFLSALDSLVPQVNEHALLAMAYGADSLGLLDDGDFDFAQASTKYVLAADGLPSKVTAESSLAHTRVYGDRSRDLLCMITFATDPEYPCSFTSKHCRSMFDQAAATLLTEIAKTHDGFYEPSLHTPTQTERTGRPGPAETSNLHADGPCDTAHSSQTFVVPPLTSKEVGVGLATGVRTGTGGCRGQSGVVRWPKRIRYELRQLIARQARELLVQIMKLLDSSAIPSNPVDFSGREAFRIQRLSQGVVLCLCPKAGASRNASPSMSNSIVRVPLEGKDPNDSTPYSLSLDVRLAAAGELVQSAIAVHRALTTSARSLSERPAAERNHTTLVPQSEGSLQSGVKPGPSMTSKAIPAPMSEPMVISVPSLNQIVSCLPFPPELASSLRPTTDLHLGVLLQLGDHDPDFQFRCDSLLGMFRSVKRTCFALALNVASAELPD